MRTLAAALTATLLLLAGCGDDDAETTASTTTVSTTSTTTASTTSTTTPSDVEDADGDEDPIETKASDDAGGAGGSAPVGEAIADHRAANGPCGEETSTDRDEVLEVDGGTVVALHCDSFAYQSIYELHGYDGARLVPLVVEQWVDGEVHEGSQILGFPFVEDGMLANIEKSRGVGDCGTYQQWTLADDVLSLSAVYHQECEDSDDPKGPEDWPRVYP